MPVQLLTQDLWEQTQHNRDSDAERSLSGFTLGSVVTTDLDNFKFRERSSLRNKGIKGLSFVLRLKYCRIDWFNFEIIATLPRLKDTHLVKVELC
jgi:putative NADPH-quinone reductase